MKINLLDSKVYNRISAGEVVEKPASVVKEMVENSIDAGATKITVEILGGGIKKIIISDNGCGIDKEDVKLAFMPHATSKIKEVEDLDNILSLGFRGEALASIASVCHVFMSSRTADSDTGYCISIDGGEFSEVKEIARNKGTTLEVSDLFYNTPVRAKFLRKEKTEEGEITHLMQKFMLAHPEISFIYIVDGKQIYNTISGELSDIIYTIYGREVYDNLIKIDYSEGNISLKGYIVSPKLSKPNRTYQTLFVNGRYVENYLISSCIQGVYEPFLMKGKFPIYILDIILPANSVDVNIHPTKKEVKFENPNAIFGFIRRAIDNALAGSDRIATLDIFDEEPNEIKTRFDHIELSKIEPLSSTEGSSYRKSRDTELMNSPIERVIAQPLSGEKIGEKEIDSSTMPDFGMISLNKIDKSNSANLFFDQSRENYTFQQYKNDCKEKNLNNEVKYENREKIFKNSLKEDLKIIGTVFNTYIIVEHFDSIYLIDQHAAHERQLYDKLITRVEKQAIVKQQLLMPYAIKVNEKEEELLENALPILEELGFDIEHKKQAFEISAIPLMLENIDLGEFIDCILRDGITWYKKSSEIIKDRLAQTACKHAIKGGDSISKEVIEDLVDNMKKGVLLCPHGRPIMVEVTKKDFEKLFKRIV